MLRLLALVLLATPSVRAEPSFLEQAEALFERAGLETRADNRFRLADQALALCEKAAADRPRETKPRLCMAHALTVSDPAHPEACRRGFCERAVDELVRARAIDVNGVEAERIASELGIVYSRLGRFPQALAEYDTALRLIEAERLTSTHETFGKSILYGNSAETLMAMGRLDEAIDRYRRAEEEAIAGSIEWKLAMWGLGVALDRDEQLEKSRLAIGRAVDKDPTMAQLSDESVFFEPAGDKLYYLALGHEQVGERKEALAFWNEYLAAQPNARWARRARVHIDALKKAPPEPRLAVPVEVTVGDPTLGRNLRSRAELTAVLRGHDDDLRRCYIRALRQGATRAQLEGEVRVAVNIHPSGRPMGDVHLADTTLSDPEMVQCVQEVLLNWRFSPVNSTELDTLIVPIYFGKRP